MGSKGAKTVATGSAAGTHVENVNELLERCDQLLGTLAFSDSFVQHMQNAIVLTPFGGNGNFNPHGGNHHCAGFASTCTTIRVFCSGWPGMGL